ncbi:hypothetical protein M011DRAFT_93998 [Sporormia fimetaria CBS 119925]|uniref:Uncharacterized protein n=1 Tax=Sporormia fimetaria CBS 119925 TaxID=1340428 RepID=A0A6A6V901_9PLEO|nr:hypothetical protein M011DRAFT_93998 [Sporormia fimetaria CBS 119925]
MTSTVYTDVERALTNPRLRSLSQAGSHYASPTYSPLATSPQIPATPINSPAILGLFHHPGTRSPSIASPPANTPVSELDSGVNSPLARSTRADLHPPDFLKLHHFHSPILAPTAPPNTPDGFKLVSEAMEMAKEVSATVAERMTALDAARPNREGFSDAEMKILMEETPKAPGE